MSQTEPQAPRYRIERASRGYHVVGPDLIVWEPSLGEAVESRAELEGCQTRYAPAPAPVRTAALFDAVVYGPVASRRLGRSLGVNLTPPGCRLCSFDCVYCAWADPPRRRTKEGVARRWPDVTEVARALGAALPGAGALDSITISGHGEPTLHPRLLAVVDAIIAVARGVRPDVPVRILTNGSRVDLPDVRRALNRLDERIVKLDADPERIERPPPSEPLGARIAALAFLRDVTLQSCFVEGTAANTLDGVVDEWIELVAEIAPRAVQIYTIDLQPPDAGILPARAAQLEEIACRLRDRTGIEASVYA